jgi:hypothetical protein
MMQQPINLRAIAEATSKGVKGSILLNKNNYILDFWFPVSFVADGAWDSERDTG